MANGEHDERFRQHEDILRSLTAMLVAQREMNQRVEGFLQGLDHAIQELKDFNQQQLGISARLETLMTRMIRHEDNGRDA